MREGFSNRKILTKHMEIAHTVRLFTSDSVRHWSTLQNMGDKRLCWDLKRCTIYSSPNELRATEQRNGCKTFQSYITGCRITHILRATTSEERHALDENGQHKSPNLMSISREIWLVKLFRQFHTSSIQYTNTEKKNS